MGIQRKRTAKRILKKKNMVGGLTLANFKTHYKAVVIKTAWHWDTNRHMDQNNRLESPETPHICSQLIFNKLLQFNQCC